MRLQRTDFSYDLDQKYIAQTPVTPRDSSKLLQLNRSTTKVTHWHFSDLPQLLQPGDVLVRNNTKVLPARLFGTKTTGGTVEILLNKPLADATTQDTNTPTTQHTTTWECLAKPGLKMDQEVHFISASDPACKLKARCVGVGTDGYTRHLKFSPGGAAFFSLLEALGTIPFPPYVDPKQQSAEGAATLARRYQTTYAKTTGSVAAPTAGLHFTPELDARLKATGITIVELTLHVGMGTFLPVKTNDIAEHHMHAEVFELPQATAACINAAKAAGNRVITVGTTTMRVLESCATPDGKLKAQSGETSIFIYPPHQFLIVDGLITNFHLPHSTLLMLVAAFATAPNTTHVFTNFLDSSVGKAYLEALKNNYRFYSFGDAMLLLADF